MTERFFIDHGMIHDRVTGSHVTTEPDTAWQDGVEKCCALLNSQETKISALTEEIDLLRARTPRAYIMTRKSEWLRMFREAIGYLHACRRQHHGTDLSGRQHLSGALEAAMKELGEPESERQARVIAEMNADEARLPVKKAGDHA